MCFFIDNLFNNEKAHLIDISITILIYFIIEKEGMVFRDNESFSPTVLDIPTLLLELSLI